jgi:hypothetical protein
MQMNFKVTYTSGETHDVKAGFADFVMFERTWNKSVTKFGDDIRLTDLAWLAWRALTSQKMIESPFEPTWLSKVENVEVLSEDEMEVPAPLEQSQP